MNAARWTETDHNTITKSMHGFNAEIWQSGDKVRCQIFTPNRGCLVRDYTTIESAKNSFHNIARKFK